MKKDLVSLVEANYKHWYQNEKRKKAAKNRVLRSNVYPNDNDVYGKRGEKNERRINGIVNR